MIRSAVNSVRVVSGALCAAALLFLSGVLMETQAMAQSAMTRHLRPAVLNGEAPLLHRMDASQSLRLDIVLPLRDQAGLDQFLKQVNDPSSPSYRQFLSVSEFTTRFGPSQADYDALTHYAAANGLHVVGGSRDGMDLQVEGRVSAIETALHVSMGVYQHPTENRVFYAPDREPSVGLPFPLWHVSGLDNYSVPQPLYVKKSDYAKAHGMKPEEVVSHATTGSGPSGSFLGSDMRAAYYGGGLTGAGQNLGLFEYAGTDLADLSMYYKNAGQTNSVPVTLLSVDGTSTSCVSNNTRNSCDDAEQTLDMTQALGMAPGLASLVMYIGSSDTAILSAMTTHSPLPTTIGCSWGWTPSDPSSIDPYFQRMAAQGQNFFAASGDNSTWTARGSSAAWPADDAYVVSVGGTDLVTAGAGGAWKSETAWADSGGGVSPDRIAIPLWQQGVAGAGSTVYRYGPDVTANANFTFYVCADQTACTANEYGGTSFAAPMWAAYMALANQQAVMNGNATVGFINPDIYSTGNSYLHDITSGASGSYSAGPGYDMVTGWGSPTPALIYNLASIKTLPGYTLSVSPNAGSLPLGAKGSVSVTTTASGGFNSPIALAASGMPTGVTVSFSPASITGAGSSTMTIAAASNTQTGTYTITVIGASGGTTHTATLNLTITRH